MCSIADVASSIAVPKRARKMRFVMCDAAIVGYILCNNSCTAKQRRADIGAAHSSCVVARTLHVGGPLHHTIRHIRFEELVYGTVVGCNTTRGNICLRPMLHTRPTSPTIYKHNSSCGHIARRYA